MKPKAKRVREVYRLLSSGASEREIADHLSRIQTEGMGLECSDASAVLLVARKLKALDIGLESQGPAV
jgi:hypothetical protein